MSHAMDDSIIGGLAVLFLLAVPSLTLEAFHDGRVGRPGFYPLLGDD